MTDLANWSWLSEVGEFSPSRISPVLISKAHPPSSRHELWPFTILQQRLSIPEKLISKLNAERNQRKSYLETPQNCQCLQHIHTADTRNLLWKVAFQGGSSWYKAAQGGGPEFLTCRQVGELERGKSGEVLGWWSSPITFHLLTSHLVVDCLLTVSNWIWKMMI